MLDDVIEERISASGQVGVLQFDNFRTANQVGHVLVAESGYPVRPEKHSAILLYGHQYSHLGYPCLVSYQSVRADKPAPIFHTPKASRSHNSAFRHVYGDAARI